MLRQCGQDAQPDINDEGAAERTGSSHDDDDDCAAKAVTICNDELALVERALRRNPKSYDRTAVPASLLLSSLPRFQLMRIAALFLDSYCAWAHRLWVIDRGVCNLEAEIALCTKLLGMDARNCMMLVGCWLCAVQ